MKGIGKYILIAFGAALLEWVWLAVFSGFFNGLGMTGAAVAGAGFFLAFEIALCTGILIWKINGRSKPPCESPRTDERGAAL